MWNASERTSEESIRLQVEVPKGHQGSQERLVMRKILLIGMLSGILYGVTYFAQRAIYHNGLVFDVIGVMKRVEPGNSTRLIFEACIYYLATLALFALYMWLILLCRQGRFYSSRVIQIALLFPVLFNAGLLFGRPYLSIDMFSYMAHGYLGNLPGHNPYLEPASAVGGLTFGYALIPWGWRPVHGITPYGPLWTNFEVLVISLTRDVSTAILLMKIPVVVANLVAGALIWAILTVVRPQDRLLGTLIYLWNPMMVLEFAGEGHNDTIMIVFVLLSLLFLVRARPAGSLVMLMLGMLAKYLPLILWPAQMVFLWRTRQPRQRLVGRLALGLGIGLALAIVLYRPFWAGSATFVGVRAAGQPGFMASTSGALFWSLNRILPQPEAARWTSLILGGIFFIVLILCSLRVHDISSLLLACARIALAYMLIASPGYWPWYGGLPLALMALVPLDGMYWLLLVVTCGSRLAAPIDTIMANEWTSWTIEVWTTTILAITLPLLTCLLIVVRHWQRSRRTTTS